MATAMVWEMGLRRLGRRHEDRSELLRRRDTTELEADAHEHVEARLNLDAPFTKTDCRESIDCAERDPEITMAF